MGGGHELISYAETEISGTKTESGSVSNYGFYVTSTSRSGSAMPDNRGVLQYKIDCTSDKSNFVVNTLLRNSGVTKADGTAITASDVNGKISTDALQIKGGENFFKKTGGSDLAKFSLSADVQERQLIEVLASMKQSYDRINLTDYCTKISNDSVDQTDIDILKNESGTMISLLRDLANECVKVLEEDVKTKLDVKVDELETMYDSAAGENLLIPEGITGNLLDTISNRGALLYFIIDYARLVMKNIAYMIINETPIIQSIKSSNYYTTVSDEYDNLKKSSSTQENGQAAYTSLQNQITLVGSKDYTVEDIVALVCLNKYNRSYNSFEWGALTVTQQGSSLFKWLAQYCLDYPNYNIFEFNISRIYGAGSNIVANMRIDYYNYNESNIQYLTDELLNNIITPSNLTLNTTPTTDTQTVQDGNTYQIFETTDQKLYWDSDKLVFEIPIELPEKTADESTIIGFKLTCEENPEYLTVATTTASE